MPIVIDPNVYVRLLNDVIDSKYDSCENFEDFSRVCKVTLQSIIESVGCAGDAMISAGEIAELIMDQFNDQVFLILKKDRNS